MEGRSTATSICFGYVGVGESASKYITAQCGKGECHYNIFLDISMHQVYFSNQTRRLLRKPPSLPLSYVIIKEVHFKPLS